MSFCSDIKSELCEIRVSRCCDLALTYGLLLFGRAFNVNRICMQSENKNVAKLYSDFVEKNYDVFVKITKGESKSSYYKAEIPSDADRLKILASVDFGIYDGNISREFFNRECCEASFVRGAFLTCGQMSDPTKSYRVDFPVKDKNLAEELRGILEKHYISANISKRGNGYVVYIKRSEMIINLLTLMGASTRSLEMIETTIIKDVKNNMNRARNCDSANIKKMVDASIKQRTAIEYLKNREMLDSLPDELIHAANLRLENPDLSLKELCQKSSEPITVSGLNHRLKRIIDIYNDIISK